MNRNPLSVIFMGSDSFSLPALELLAGEENLQAVITQPDRPKGRGLHLSPGPVKQRALELGLKVYQPEKLKDPQAVETIRALNPQLIVTAAFGQLVPRAVLEIPPLGCLNLHPSLLPKYRGAIPVEAALMAGETVTGSSIFYMDKGWDSGDILLREETPILPEETGGELRSRLAVSGAELLKKALELIRSGNPPRTPQDHEQATYEHSLKKADLLIDWSREAETLRNFIRALNPHWGAGTVFREKNLKIYRALSCENKTPAPPGTVVETLKDRGPVVKCGGDTALLLLEVKPEGKNLIPARDFLNGYRVSAGEKLG